MKKIIWLLLLLVFMSACGNGNFNIDYETEPPMNINGGITSIPQNSLHKEGGKVAAATSSATPVIFPLEFENENRSDSDISYTDNKVLFPNGNIVRGYYANHFILSEEHKIPSLNQKEFFEIIELLETNVWLSLGEAKRQKLM